MKIPAESSKRANARGIIEKWINTGKLKAGDMVPTETDLSKIFKIARGTLRDALSDLEKEGLIAKPEGRKRRVVSPIRSNSIHFHSFALVQSESINDIDSKVDPLGDQGLLEREVIECAMRAGWHLIHLHIDSFLNHDAGWLARNTPRGFIFHPDVRDSEQSNRFLEYLCKNNVAIVACANETAIEIADCVLFDHEMGAYLLTKHFISMGLRRIRPVWNIASSHWLEARWMGYERAMKEANLKPQLARVVPELRLKRNACEGDRNSQWKERVSNYLGYCYDDLTGKDRAEALLLTNDMEVPPMDTACRKLGLRPREDIHLAGYDNTYNLCPDYHRNCALPTATINKHSPVLGRVALDLLQERIENGPKAPLKTEVVAPDLVVL